jgi:hypothetical protein
MDDKILDTPNPKAATDAPNPKTVPDSPLSPKIEPTPPHKPKTCHYKPDHTPVWKMILEVVAGVCALALVVITFYYTRAAYRQLGAMNGQLGEMRNETYVSCLSAQLSRNLLIQTRNTSNDAHNAMLASAYQAIATIQPQEASLAFNLAMNDVVQDHEIGTYGEPINNGNSYAVDVHWKLRAEFVPRDKDPEFTYPKNLSTTGYASRFAKGQLNIFRGFISIRDATGKAIKATSVDVDDFKSSKKDVIVYGSVTYKDTFGVSHWTHGCYVAAMTLPPNTIMNTGHLKCAQYSKTDTNTVFPDTFSPSTPSPVPPEIICKPPDGFPK